MGGRMEPTQRATYEQVGASCYRAGGAEARQRGARKWVQNSQTPRHLQNPPKDLVSGPMSLEEGRGGCAWQPQPEYGQASFGHPSAGAVCIEDATLSSVTPICWGPRLSEALCPGILRMGASRPAAPAGTSNNLHLCEPQFSHP